MRVRRSAPKSRGAQTSGGLPGGRGTGGVPRAAAVAGAEADPAVSTSGHALPPAIAGLRETLARRRDFTWLQTAAVALGTVLACCAYVVPATALAWHFTDVTAEAGLVYQHGLTESVFSEVHAMAGGVAAGDYDGDGWVDLYAVHGDIGPNLLFHNRGDGTFEEVGASAGVALVGALGSGPTFADVDGDGRLDLLVLGVGGTRPTLFRNQGDGTFKDVTSASRLVTSGNDYSAAFGDYDRDGDLDLFLTHWGSGYPGPVEDLWRNDGDGSFTDVGPAAGIARFVSPRAPSGFDYSFTPNFADLDGDGWPDLLVAADFGGSRVFINQRDGTFRDATTSVVSDENGMGAAVGDFDNDGDLDWFVSSIWDPNGVAEGNWGISGNRLYRNRGDGTFEDATDAAGVRKGYWGWAATFADLDNDGVLDLFQVNGFGEASIEATSEYHDDPARLFVGNGDGSFSERAAALGLDDKGQGRGVVAFDYDRDGDVDLFIANFGGPPRLFRNDGGNEHAFLTVRLRGRAPNTEAIGARVYLRAGGRTQMREVHAGSNFVSQDPAETHFGLGRLSVADELRIVWPDGRTTVRTRVPVNRMLAIREPPTLPLSCTGAGRDDRCIPGGGKKATDCLVEWRFLPGPPRRRNRRSHRKAVCFEGDPGCDVDLDLSNASCTFRVAVCVNNADRRLAACSASGLLTLEVTHPASQTVDLADRENRATLERCALGFGISVRPGASAVFINDTPNACSESGEFVVPLRRSRRGIFAPGTRKLGLTGTAPSGARDIDVVHLQCRPSTCGNGGVERDHEECDDGNRNGGDGCDRGCRVER